MPAREAVEPARSGRTLAGRGVRAARARRARASGRRCSSFLLRWRRCAGRLARRCRCWSLDFVGVFAAIFTALCLKAAVRDAWNLRRLLPPGPGVRRRRRSSSRRCCSRARGCTPTALTRPGLPRIVACAVPDDVVALLFAVVSGEEFSSYYIFYGTLFFAVAYVVDVPLRYEQRLRGVAARRRLPAPRGARRHRRAHRGGRPRARRRGHRRVDVVGFISLTPRPDNGLRSLGTLEDLDAVLDDHRVDEVIIADPDFPQEQAVELVDAATSAASRVRIAPSTMEILIHRAEFVPGQSVPLFELKPPGLRRRRLRRQAHVRRRRLARCCCWCSRPLLIAIARRDQAVLARAGASTARCGPGSAACRSPA